MSGRYGDFTGSIPEIYDKYLGPVMLNDYGADLAHRVVVGDDARVLEIAAGTGVSTRRLRDDLPDSVTLVVTDLNDPLLDIAREKFSPDEKVEFRAADATSLPFEDEEFDTVTCQFGVMLFPDKLAALREARRVLKPGGTLVFNVWDSLDRNPLVNTVAKTIQEFFPDGSDNFFDVPFGFHDERLIHSLLEETGFEDVTVEACPREAVADSASHAAVGFVKGSPMILEIRDNPEIGEDAVVDAVASAIADLGGDNPLRARIQAIFVTARRMNRIAETENTRIELGELSDLDVVDKLVDVSGLDLVDAGCAAGDAARGLAERGATVMGVEPDPVQAESNRSKSPTPGVTLLEAGAQALPAEDNSADGVFLFRSLHHVPEDLMDQALKEAARVLKPEGFLFVVEPAMDCTFYRLMQPFHDERKMRTLAQAALDRTASGLFEEAAKYQCIQRPKFADFDAFVDMFTGMSFNRITREMMDQPEVRDNFDAARTDDGYVFEQPMLINIYRRPRG